MNRMDWGRIVCYGSLVVIGLTVVVYVLGMLALVGYAVFSFL